MKTYQAGILTILVIIVLILLGLYYTKYNVGNNDTSPDSQTNGQTDSGNTAAKADLVRVTSPLPSASVTNPLTITGEARGSWYFEASFPVELTDWNGKIIARGIAKAQGDWMTTDFVPFTASLAYSLDEISGSKSTAGYSNRAILTLKKDNPSGLPENDDAVEFPVYLH